MIAKQGNRGDSFGIASTSNPIRFPMSSNPAAIVTPVMLPPGRAMLATSPIAIGSIIAVTIGIVVVGAISSRHLVPRPSHLTRLRIIFFALLFFGSIAFVICAIGAMISIH
jgi:hypothetical protein